MPLVRQIDGLTGRLKVVDEVVATGYVTVTGRYKIGSPVGDPEAARRPGGGDPPVVVPPAPSDFSLSNTGDAFLFSFPAYAGPGTLKGYVTKSSYGVNRQPVDVTPLMQTTSGVDGSVYDGRTMVYWHYAVLTDDTEVLIGSQTGTQPARTWITSTTTYTITQGGTYTGNYRCTTPGVAAVTIGTSSPVTLDGMRVSSLGNGITGFNNRATVKNCRIWIQNPGGTGRLHGHGVNLEQWKTANVRNNYIENPGVGVQLKNYTGDTITETAYVLFNRFRNITGMKTDGNGGYQLPLFSGTDSSLDKSFDRFQTIMFLANLNVPGGEIAWNISNNEAEWSRVEDNINTYGSTAQASKRLLIHDNLIDGAYPYRPAYPVTGFANKWYTGGGILPADSNGAYTDVYDNVLVRGSHYGIGILNGHDNSSNRNRIVASPYLWDGRRNYARNNEAGNTIALIFWSSDSSVPFYNNVMQDNFFASTAFDTNGNLYEVGNFTPAATASTYTGNTRFKTNVTLQDEIAEISMYRDRVLAAGYTIGAA